MKNWKIIWASSNVKNVRVLIRYDIENLSEETYKKALVTIFSEPPVDLVYEEEFTEESGRPGVFRGISAGTV